MQFRYWMPPALDAHDSSPVRPPSARHCYWPGYLWLSDWCATQAQCTGGLNSFSCCRWITSNSRWKRSNRIINKKNQIVIWFQSLSLLNPLTMALDQVCHNWRRHDNCGEDSELYSITATSPSWISLFTWRIQQWVWWASVLSKIRRLSRSQALKLFRGPASNAGREPVE